MPAEPPPDRRGGPPRPPRPRPAPRPRPVDDPTSRVAPVPATPRGRHELSPAPVPPSRPDPESTTRVPTHDPERTAMFDRVAPASAERAPQPRHAVRPPRAPVDPPTTAMPQAPRPDASATTRVSVEAERTRALARVERTVAVPRPPRAPRPAPPRPAPVPPAEPPAPPPPPREQQPPPEPPGPVGSPLPGLAWRAALVVVSAALALLGVPAIVAAPVVVATTAVVAERVARHRRRGLLDLVLTAVAGTAAAPALLGIALNVAPMGVSTPGWAIGGGLLGLVALACCARRPPVPGVPQMIASRRERRRPTPLAAVCVGAAVLVVAATLAGSVLSAQANQLPPLQISAGPVVDGRVEVRLDAGSTSGAYDLVLVTDGRRTVVSLGMRLEPGQVQTVPVPLPIPVPAAGSAAPPTLVQLVAAGGTDPLRQLVLAAPQEGR